MVNTYWKTPSYQTWNVKLFCCAFSFSRLPAEARQNDAVKHALSVRAAVSSGNYVAFFRLYKTAPNLNMCLMGVFCSEWLIFSYCIYYAKYDDVNLFFADLYADKMRYAAIRCMSRSNRPTVPVTYIAQVLGFTSVLSTNEESEDTDGVEDCVEWLKAHGACLTSDNSGEMQFDAKVRCLPIYTQVFYAICSTGSMARMCC